MHIISKEALTTEERDWASELLVFQHIFHGLKQKNSIMHSWQIRMNLEEFKGWWEKLGCNSLFFDGASKGNPRMAGVGGVYFNSKGIKMKEYAWGIDMKTNNGAKWLALIKALELERIDGVEELVVFGDSCMVIG